MLKTLDKALAGAIDVIADDVQATVKSVREQGVMRTLGDAVEDAASLVTTGASSVLGGLVGGKRGPERVSTHSGVSSSYADLCAGGGSRGPTGAGGGAAFPYMPGPSGRAGSTAVPKFGGGFGPGIGIQRAAAPAFPGGVQVFAKSPAPSFNPPLPSPGAYRPQAAPTPYMPSVPATSSCYSTPSPVAGKDPILEPGELASRFEAVRSQEAANEKCFDCQAPAPEWASVSFGVLLCIECAGHHRRLGTHISRIRSFKMDSWTEKQFQIFQHGGNGRLKAFLDANKVQGSLGFNRYMTPAAEWYREAWIKSRTLGKPVPPPPAGVTTGPCVGGDVASAPAAKAAAPAPVADLLDFGGDTRPAGGAAAPAPQADLLGFDDGPSVPQARALADADLLGVSSPSSGELFSLSSPSTGGDIFSLSSLTVQNTPSPPLNVLQPPVSPSTSPNGLARPQDNSSPLGGNTLGAGAKLVETPKKVEADPFAMALEKWGM